MEFIVKFVEEVTIEMAFPVRIFAGGTVFVRKSL